MHSVLNSYASVISRRRKPVLPAVVASVLLSSCAIAEMTVDVPRRDAIADGLADAPQDAPPADVSDVSFDAAPDRPAMCIAPMTLCAGACVDTDRDPSNCGSCGTMCPGGDVCVAGMCVRNCAGGLMPCGTACVDMQRNTMHCGRCFNACNVGQSCVAGRCTFECMPGETACAMGCVNTNVDANNCGACGNTCPSGPRAMGRCVSGRCSLACDPGWADCNMNPSDGCEADLTSSSSCGACGRVCSPIANGTHSCVMGVCAIRCDANFGDCNRNPADGCETALIRSPNCGTCSRSCTGTAAPNCCPGLTATQPYACSTRWVMCNP